MAVPLLKPQHGGFSILNGRYITVPKVEQVDGGVSLGKGVEKRKLRARALFYSLGTLLLVGKII